MFYQEYYVPQSAVIGQLQTHLNNIYKVLEKNKFNYRYNKYAPKDRKAIAKEFTQFNNLVNTTFNFDPASQFYFDITKNFEMYTTFMYNPIVYECYNCYNDIKITDIIEKKDKFFRYKKDDMCYREIHFSIPALELLEPREAMACIFHEIGHSFQFPVRLYGYRLEMANVIRKLCKKVGLAYDPDPESTLYKFFGGVAYDFGSSTGDETFADQFATSMGYGQEIATSLAKIDKMNYEYYNKNNSLVWLFPQLIGLLILGLIDEHPNTAQRTSSAIAIMLKESNNPRIPPKYRAALKKKIAQMEEGIEKNNAIEKGDSPLVILQKKIQLLKYDSISDLKKNDLNSIKKNQTIGLDW